MACVTFNDQNDCAVIGLLKILRRNAAGDRSRIILDGCKYVAKISQEEHGAIAADLAKAMLNCRGEPIAMKGVWAAE